jgi:hypothetical protein
LKTMSTWFRSRVLHENLVPLQADVATEQWDDLPPAVPGFLVRPEPQPPRRSTPPPLPPARAPAAAAEWQSELNALAGAAVSPVDPADVPTPPPLATSSPAPAAAPAPPPKIAAPLRTAPPPAVAAPKILTTPPTPKDLRALAKSAASPVDPADVPTPPPIAKPSPKAPKLPAPGRAVPSDDGDWDSVIARAKGRPVKVPGPRP